MRRWLPGGYSRFVATANRTFLQPAQGIHRFCSNVVLRTASLGLRELALAGLDGGGHLRALAGPRGIYIDCYDCYHYLSLSLSLSLCIYIYNVSMIILIMHNTYIYI